MFKFFLGVVIFVASITAYDVSQPEPDTLIALHEAQAVEVLSQHDAAHAPELLPMPAVTIDLDALRSLHHAEYVPLHVAPAVSRRSRHFEGRGRERVCNGVTATTGLTRLRLLSRTAATISARHA
jgi:hypothetical protein